MLVAGVIKIHKFLKDKDWMNQMNTPTLVMHAIAFGLFFVSTTLLAIANTFDVFMNTNFSNPRIDKIFSIVYFTDMIAQFVAQLILAKVLWGWATETPE